MLVLLVCDLGLQLIMHYKGFKYSRVGTVNYYHHPGGAHGSVSRDTKIPIIFCHGIGIGLIYYLPLINELLKLGHPLLLPEIPYVCGFRPWQNLIAILSPSQVCSTLSAMLAINGYTKGIFMGHSFGSSWVSYICKYASPMMSAVVFLDPICFGTYHPCLTKNFIYTRPDPGSVSFMVKTDVIVNWTIQRAFPWISISLFTEDIPAVPCAIFLSEVDELIPVDEIQSYLETKGAILSHFDSDAAEGNLPNSEGFINVTIFRGDNHGAWVMRPSAVKTIAMTADIFAKNDYCDDRSDLSSETDSQLWVVPTLNFQSKHIALTFSIHNGYLCRHPRPMECIYSITVANLPVKTFKRSYLAMEGNAVIE